LTSKLSGDGAQGVLYDLLFYDFLQKLLKNAIGKDSVESSENTVVLV